MRQGSKESAEYLIAMRTLAEDAKVVLAGYSSNLLEVSYQPPAEPTTPIPISPNLTPRNIFHYLLEHLQKSVPIFRTAPVIPLDPHVIALTDMFLDLQSSIT